MEEVPVGDVALEAELDAEQEKELELEEASFWAYSERDRPWQVFYHMIIFGAVMQYAWMVCWLIMKVNYEWTTIGNFRLFYPIIGTNPEFPVKSRISGSNFNLFIRPDIWF